MLSQYHENDVRRVPWLWSLYGSWVHVLDVSLRGGMSVSKVEPGLFVAEHANKYMPPSSSAISKSIACVPIATGSFVLFTHPNYTKNRALPSPFSFTFRRSPRLHRIHPARNLQDITPSPVHDHEDHDDDHSSAPTMVEGMTAAPTNVDGTSGSSVAGPAPGRSFAGAVTTCAVALIAGVMWAL